MKNISTMKSPPTCKQRQDRSGSRPKSSGSTNLRPLLKVITLVGLLAQISSTVVADTNEPQERNGRMPLSQFQTILRTFVDDEMAYVLDSSFQGAPVEQQQPPLQSNSNGVANATILDMTLKSQMSGIDQVDIVTQGHHLNQHHGRGRQRRHRKLSESGTTEEEYDLLQHGRYPQDALPPVEIENAWQNIVVHAWDMAKLSSSTFSMKEDNSQQTSQQGTKTKGVKSSRGRRITEEESDSRDDLASNDNSVHMLDFPMHEVLDENEDGEMYQTQEDSDSQDGATDAASSNWTHGITIDDIDDEVVPTWANEGDSLFLTCHNSTEPMSGNDHLKAMLARSGKDSIKVEDFQIDGQQKGSNHQGSYLNVIYSSPKLVCVILPMQPTYAEAIANKKVDDTLSSIMTIVPWIDVMKISPDVFHHILSGSASKSEGGSSGGDGTSASGTRGLRNFRRATAEDPLKDLMWDSNQESADASLEHKSVIFTLAPPSNTLDDAKSVIEDLIVMAKNGQRRRRRLVARGDQETDKHTSERRLFRGLSIDEAFSVSTRPGQPHSGNSGHPSSWSHIISRGLESVDDGDSCIAILQGIELEPSFLSSFEFPLLGATKSTTPSPECLASIIAGVSTHPHIVNVGILSKEVQLDNEKAQWVVQGAVSNRQNERIRPFFQAGLDGSGQVVSIADTGLDVNNCYFKDDRGKGSSFSSWDYSRRKVVRYDVSTRGGDTSDTVRGHGTHVVGTVAGRHLLDDTLGDGDDIKEGIAPGAKVHFYDIGKGYVVNDPREHWFESFYHNHPRVGAKVASGSWGFGYRESYDWVCQLYDQQLVDRPDVLYISSAGNTGNKFDSPSRTVGAPASCKNAFAVGATNSADFGDLHYVVDFSSRGPTADGRTKPDILAPGYALNSALSGSTDCKQKEGGYLKAGTSMSAPVVAGMSALVRQYFQEGWYPCGSKGCGQVINPSGTLTKAVLANGAQFTKGVQVGGTTTIINDQPVRRYDNTQNMGETDLSTSLPLEGLNSFNMFVQNEVALANGEEKVFYLSLDKAECSTDLTATLTWYDPPGANGCMRCIRNDLDLQVNDITSSRVYFPNDKPGPDSLNNIERVQLNKRRTTVGNRYKVGVKANMLGPGYSTQKFSLVITGCFTSVNENEAKEPQDNDNNDNNDNDNNDNNNDNNNNNDNDNFELATTYQANRKQAGNMFGAKAKTDGVSVKAFAIHTLVSGRKIKLHVYTRKQIGGLNGDETFLGDPSAWTLVSPAAGIQVDAMGFGSPTIIPEGSFPPVSIAKGTTRSFYLTMGDEAEMLYKAVDSEYPTGATYTSDNNIEIMTGVGKAANFGMNWQSRQMNGAVFYSVSTSSGEGLWGGTQQVATPMPTPPPSRQPTTKPTQRPVEQQSTSLIFETELQMTMSANKKQAGNMFDVIAKQDIAISSFKIHTLLKSTIPVTIYTRLGSWENYDKKPAAWEKIGTVNVDCKGYGQSTIVSGFRHFQLASGSTRAFYLTLDDPELLYFYSSQYPSGTTYAEDDAMKIKTGVGKGVDFGTTYLSRQLNGALVYYLL